MHDLVRKDLNYWDKTRISQAYNKIIEYFGEGAESLSCTAKATATNMGAELGATTSVFPFDKRMADYLRATGRAEIASLAASLTEHLTADA